MPQGTKDARTGGLQSSNRQPSEQVTHVLQPAFKTVLVNVGPKIVLSPEAHASYTARLPV